MSRIISFLLSIVMLLFPSLNIPEVELDTDRWNTNYTYVFVHGLSGWGSYDAQYKLMPYWGMFGGDLMKYLNARGFDCVAASVAPQGSAWDRACELYAQLTGKVTDYGAEHSSRCKHERFGPDFTGKALIDEWSTEKKINILGHSFGGATVRLFAELMANGSSAERSATKQSDISEFFTGGKADWIYSLTSLAAPHNGTTAYETGGEVQTVSDAASADTAAYDMHIDNALELNKRISTLPDVYYFSYACTSTVKNADGSYSPINEKTEIIFRSSAEQLGKYTGTTAGGYVIDEKWLENDGLVNTYSALAPLYAPSISYSQGNAQRGMWNIMPVYDGDHMSLQGGLFKTNNVRTLYVDFFCMINSL